MGQLEEEIKDASRGRIIPSVKPDDGEHERKMRDTEEAFEKVNEDRDARERPKT